MYVAGLEVLALSAYGQMVELVNAGKVPPPAPAFGALIDAARAQHQAHLDSWNAALVKAGHGQITQPDPGLVNTLGPIIQKVISIGVGQAALSLEQLVAANYVTVTSSFSSSENVRLAGSVEVVEMQHVAAALYLLNMPPFPNAFAHDALSQ